MTAKYLVQGVGRGVTLGLGAAAGAYAAYASATWLRYGRADSTRPGERDALLNTFMPVHEIVERHRVFVRAPADITFAALREVDFERSRLIAGIFKTRAFVLGSDRDTAERPRGLLAWLLSLGWGVLAEIPGREIVVGAVTRPWDANVVFRAIPPAEFERFNEAGYVKIAWTLRADPIGDRFSIARTETRAVATDASARARFRRYWSIFSPGIVVIRHASLKLVKRDAEQRAADGSADGE